MSGTLWYCPTCGMVDSKDVGYANDQWRNFHYHVNCDTRVSRLAPEFIVAMRERIAMLEAAIREHRNKMWEGYRVADRLDQQLYAVLQEDKPHE